MLASSAAAGCILVTGSTDGYRGVDAAASPVCPDGSCPSTQCASAAQCGDSGAFVCCLSVNLAMATTTTSCERAPCGAMAPLHPIQLCAGNAECGDAGACTPQTCTAGATPFPPINACGVVAGCTAL
jgi:hypothetical protein